MSDTLDQDQGQGPPGPMPGGPGGPPGNNPGAQPGAGGPMMPGQPPPGFGRPGPRPSVPGAGTRGGGLVKMIQGIRMIQAAMLELPIGSDVHKDASKAVDMLSKHLNMGQETQGITTTGISQLLQQLARGAMAGRAGAPGAQSAPAMPPSMPLPGA